MLEASTINDAKAVDKVSVKRKGKKVIKTTKIEEPENNKNLRSFFSVTVNKHKPEKRNKTVPSECLTKAARDKNTPASTEQIKLGDRARKNPVRANIFMK